MNVIYAMQGKVFVCGCKEPVYFCVVFIYMYSYTHTQIYVMNLDI